MNNKARPLRARFARRARRLRAGLAVALLAFTTSGLAQEPDLARAEALVRAGQFAEAYQLLEPFEDRMAGDLKYDYLLARAALESGRASKASFIYERILALEPNYVGVRLEMGRAYLALGDYARAKLEFETVLRFDNLPPDLQEQAQIYARTADQYLAGRRLIGYGYAEYGFGHDSNPLSATKIQDIRLADGSILTLPASALKRGDYYHAVTLGGELIYALTNNVSVYGGLDGRGRWHHDISVADFQNIDGRLGVGYTQGRFNARVGFAGGEYWLNNTSTRETWGVTTDLRYLLDNRDQLSLTAGAARFHFVPAGLKVNNYDLFQGGLGWLRSVNDGRGAFGITVNGGYENATDGRPDGDKPFFGGRLTFQTAVTERIGAFLLGGASRGLYRTINPAFDARRRDTLYDVVAGVTWSFAAGWSLRPQIVYIKNASNIDLYEFDRTDVSLNLRKDF